MEQERRGGVRKGAGRPATGPKTERKMFSLSHETIALLEEIPLGERSQFVNDAITARLRRNRKKGSVTK